MLALFPVAMLSMKSKNVSKDFGVLVFIFIINYINTSYENFKRQYGNKELSTYIYLPKDVYYLKYKNNVKFDTVILYTKKGKEIKLYSTNLETWTYDMFPCTTKNIVDLKLRGEDLQSGFVKISQ